MRLRDEPKYTGIIDMHDWVPEIGKMAVAIAPLEISRFNHGKSRLKVVEASATGTPWVASPRTEYRRFHKESGGGLLANTPKEWFKAIKQLMDNETMRKELGEQGREHTRTQTIEANSWRAMEAWQLAYDMQHGRVSA
jgi:glycosyltransferase involved in cell wall biosynthesis